MIGRSWRILFIVWQAWCLNVFLPAHTPLDGEAVVNLAGSYEVAPGITLLVKGVNVFDERYEEALDFATQRASIYGGVSAAF